MHFHNRIVAILLLFVLLLIQISAASAEEVYYIAPTLSKDADVYDPDHPENLKANQLYAESAILIVASTGEVIFEKDADKQMYPASTTKILTVLLGVQNGDFDQTVYLSEADMEGIASDDAVMDLDVGESINFLDLLYGTFIRSANEGANLIAETVSGSISSFVNLMNQTAQSLGCEDTHFVNPNGLHDDNHYTTARDMATIARYAMQNETFRKIACSYTYSLPKSNLHKSRVLTHSSRALFNPSLEDNPNYYQYAIGIKSGYHARAGYCFVGAAEKDGVELISVVFYTTKDGRWTDTVKLLEYGFSQFTSMSPLEMYATNPITIETSRFSLEDEGYGRLELSARLQSNSTDIKIVGTISDLEEQARKLRQTVQIEYTRDFAAPIEQGELFGTMTYYPEDGTTPITYDLVASRSVAARENGPLTLEEIEAEVYADPNPFPPLSVELVLMCLLFLAVLASPIYLFLRLTHRIGKHKHSKIPKPTNRFYR